MIRWLPRTDARIPDEDVVVLRPPRQAPHHAADLFVAVADADERVAQVVEGVDAAPWQATSE